MRRTELVVRSGRGIGRAHRLLDLERGPHRLDRAREFGQQAVAGQLEHPAAVMLDDGLAVAMPSRSRRRPSACSSLRADMVLKPDDVDGDDRGQPPDQGGVSIAGCPRPTGYPSGRRQAIGAALQALAMLCDDRWPCNRQRLRVTGTTTRSAQKFPLGSTTFTEQEIVDFARQFDPQSFHVDAEAAKDSMFGGMIASGWHVAAKMMRLFVDNYVDQRTALGSPGLDELRWLKPVRPGDTLTGWVECAARCRPRAGRRWASSTSTGASPTRRASW